MSQLKTNKNSKDSNLIFIASFLRAVSIGMIAVLLAIYLMKTGLTKTQVGMLISVGLFGAAAGNLFVTFFGDRIGRRKVLIAYSLLNALGAISVFVLSQSYALLLPAVFLGMVNARGRDRGAALVLETAILPSLDPSKDSTKTFAWYALFQDIGLAVGGVVAGLPTLLSSQLGVPDFFAFQCTFGVYAALMILSAMCYSYLSEKAEVSLESVKYRFSPEGKKVITKLAALFTLDSLAGGFLTSTLIAYYFYERFGIGIETVGFLFFFARCINAASYFASVWLAKRIGMINTMVFTHTPSHLLLIAVAFAPTFPIAVVLFLLREALVEMDVPTRQAYVMAVIKPEERTKAAGITQMVRMMGWAVAPTFAGFVMHNVSLAMPLFIGAGIKITYDLLIFLSFRKIKPLQEKKPAEVTA